MKIFDLMHVVPYSVKLTSFFNAKFYVQCQN